MGLQQVMDCVDHVVGCDYVNKYFGYVCKIRTSQEKCVIDSLLTLYRYSVPGYPFW